MDTAPIRGDSSNYPCDWTQYLEGSRAVPSLREDCGLLPSIMTSSPRVLAFNTACPCKCGSTCYEGNRRLSKNKAHSNQEDGLR